MTQSVLLATTPAPSPSPSFNPDVVTPGPIGFVVMFLLTLVVVLLILDMIRRIRRVRYRGEARERQERLAEEQRAAQQGEPGA